MLVVMDGRGKTPDEKEVVMTSAAHLAMLLSAGMLGWSDEAPPKPPVRRRPLLRLTWRVS